MVRFLFNNNTRGGFGIGFFGDLRPQFPSQVLGIVIFHFWLDQKIPWDGDRGFEICGFSSPGFLPICGIPGIYIYWGFFILGIFGDEDISGMGIFFVGCGIPPKIDL